MSNLFDQKPLSCFFDKSKVKRGSSKKFPELLRIIKGRKLCHITGKDKRVAQVTCVSNTRKWFFKTVLFVFHKPSNYDADLIFTEISKQKKNADEFDFSAKSDEKFVSNIYGCLKLTNSFSLMKENLEALLGTFRYEDFS